jgi:hypothetical protein
MVFGQLVIGPPGSGKTTYCHGMQQYLSALGRRVAIVNLDPANDVLPYTPDVDVAELVCLDTVMEELHLGPNGGEHQARLAVPLQAKEQAGTADQFYNDYCTVWVAPIYFKAYPTRVLRAF